MIREVEVAVTEAARQAALVVTVVITIAIMVLVLVLDPDHVLEKVAVMALVLRRVLVPGDIGHTLVTVRLVPTLARVLVLALARIDTVLIMIGLLRQVLINLLNKALVYFCWRRSAVGIK